MGYTATLKEFHSNAQLSESDDVPGSDDADGTRVIAGTDSKVYNAMEIPKYIQDNTDQILFEKLRILPTLDTSWAGVVSNLRDVIRPTNSTYITQWKLAYTGGRDLPNIPTVNVLESHSDYSTDKWPSEISNINWDNGASCIHINHGNFTTDNTGNAFIYGDMIVNLDAIPYFRNDASNASGLWVVECTHNDSVNVTINERDVYFWNNYNTNERGDISSTDNALFINRTNKIRITFMLHNEEYFSECQFKLFMLDKSPMLIQN